MNIQNVSTSRLYATGCKAYALLRGQCLSGNVSSTESGLTSALCPNTSSPSSTCVSRQPAYRPTARLVFIVDLEANVRVEVDASADKGAPRMFAWVWTSA